MDSTEIILHPIGIIHSRHTEPEKTPIQPVFARECEGTVEVFAEYTEGLRDLEGYSHIYLLYHFHRGGAPQMSVKPFLQDRQRGVFSTRSPLRPNPVGMSIVELLRIEGSVLHVRGVDILDGSPLLDIKPYSARFDRIEGTRNGWQDEVDEDTAGFRGRRGFGKD